MTKRVYIAMPSGSAKPDVETTLSLQKTTHDLRSNGIEAETRHIFANCYIAYVRDLLANLFKKSTCGYLHFWDDDVIAPEGALRRLLRHDRDIVCAPYPKKCPPDAAPKDKWPLRLVDGIPDEAGLLKSEMVATGFLLIRRNVIEKLYELHADRCFFDKEYGEIVDLFPTGLLPDFPLSSNGSQLWWGEDYAFSVFARRAGFTIWLDPNIQLGHVGRQVWYGDFTANADAA